MRLSILGLLGLAGSLAAAAAAAPADDGASPLTTTVTISVPASHALPNPNVLLASTRATLSARGAPPSLSAPLTAANTFVFSNVSAGSYLLDVHCATHAFAPLRVDVVPAPQNQGVGTAAGKAKKKAPASLAVRAWETFRGNDWGNKGEAARRTEDGGFEVRCLGRKEFYMERSGFSVFSILKNPMILLALVSMGIFLGMPYLMDNMDPEVRAEFEARQKSNPMNAVLGAAGGGGQGGAGGFDMAAFLAGSNSNNNDKRIEQSGPAPAAAQSGGGNGGGKKGQRR